MIGLFETWARLPKAEAAFLALQRGEGLFDHADDRIGFLFIQSIGMRGRKTACIIVEVLSRRVVEIIANRRACEGSPRQSQYRRQPHQRSL